MAIAVLVPTMHVGCSLPPDTARLCFDDVLVPTMHVGCSRSWLVVAKEQIVLVPTMHVGCSLSGILKYRYIIAVLVPTMHVGCSRLQIRYSRQPDGFSTHDARGL